jgi:hypothetical protein
MRHAIVAAGGGVHAEDSVNIVKPFLVCACGFIFVAEWSEVNGYDLFELEFGAQDHIMDENR